MNTLRFQDEMTNLGAEVRLLSGLPSSGCARRINTLAQLSVVQEVYCYCTVTKLTVTVSRVCIFLSPLGIL